LAEVSRGTYEFYLVHGPVYLGFTKVLGFGLIGNIWIATPVAVLMSYLLRQACQWTNASLLHYPGTSD
jgi:peptidoglycan/LPS O-acetylase OafA/YrhL